MSDQSGKNNPAYKHGHTTAGKFSPEYHSWACMWSRCNATRGSRIWKYYGGKGIGVCNRWKSFENFLLDMGPRPPNLSLERKNGDLNYEPGNCVWADDTTQNRNSSQVVWVEIDGVRKRLVEWCEELGVSINTVRARVWSQGMNYQQAILKPTKRS